MPRREDPESSRHGIVAAYYPGASAAEVENQVTQKVEQRLFKVEGVRRGKTYSTSLNGVMFINVEVEDNVFDTDKFWSKLRLDMAELRATDSLMAFRSPSSIMTSVTRWRYFLPFTATGITTAN